MPPTRRLALAATERVIHGVHCCTTHMRALAQPAIASGLTYRHILVINVADLANRRDTGGQNFSYLARGHAKRGVPTFPRNQLYR